MKKTAVIAAMLLLCASQAGAYENTSAGYSVKDRKPFYKMESSRLYAFSGFEADAFSKLNDMKTGSVHAVNYYTAEEMGQILGEAFSTAYFERQYEQLALLQRSELDLRTIPAPLLELPKYAALTSKSNVVLQLHLLQGQQAKLEPKLRIDKLGAHKAITLTYLYKQGQLPIFLHTSFLSANDRLYQLTTLSFSEQPKTEGKQDKPDAVKKITGGEETVIWAASSLDAEDLQQALKIEPLQEKDLDAALSASLWQAHRKFVQSFKSIKPTGQRPPLSYRDFAAPNSILLPQDWFYAQMQFKDKEGAGSFTYAASLPVMQKIVKEFDNSGLVALMGLLDRKEPAHDSKSSTDANTAAKAPAAADSDYNRVTAEAHKALNSLDALLVTSSIKVKDNDLRDMLNDLAANKMATEAEVHKSLKRLLHSSNDFFSLKHYDYHLDFAADKANVDINTEIVLLKEHALKNLLRFTAHKDSCALMLFVRKPDYSAEPQLQQSIEQWQF